MLEAFKMWVFIIGLNKHIDSRSEVYLLRYDLTSENVVGYVANKSSQFWLVVKRQTFATQILLSFLVLQIAFKK
jgi:hypothetical protein